MGKKASSAGAALERKSVEILDESDPLRRETLDNALAALHGQFQGSAIPLAQRAFESSRQASSAGLRDLDSQIAGLGLDPKSPFVVGLRDQNIQRGELAGAQASTDVVRGFASMAPNLALGFPQVGLQGLSGAAQAQTSAANAELGVLGQIFGAAGQIGFGAFS